MVLIHAGSEMTVRKKTGDRVRDPRLSGW